MRKSVIIYLAGGMRGSWQDLVMADVRKRVVALPLIFLDPRQNGTQLEEVYTAWDLDAVQLADVLFTVLTEANPAGQGLCLEIGAAQGMQRAGATKKHIIFVCKKKPPAVPLPRDGAPVLRQRCRHRRSRHCTISQVLTNPC